MILRVRLTGIIKPYSFNRQCKLPVLDAWQLICHHMPSDSLYV